MNRRGFVSLVGGALAAVLGTYSRLFANDSAYKINIDEFPELADDKGYLVVKDVIIDGEEDNIIIVRKSPTEFIVLSSICRHKKCNVKYKAKLDILVCPCHGSNYDLDGAMVKGPSNGPLPRYKAQLNGKVLTITR